MPFGLANAPAIFQRFIQWVLREYLDVFCFVYLDDILIFSKTRDQHVVHVSKVLDALMKNNLTASAEKCSFFSDSVTFLGFIITTSGIEMDPAKLSTIRDWPYPENLGQLQKFLGFANFYRRFISHFSSIVTPLTSLTGKNVQTVSLLQQKPAMDAFKLLRDLFISAPFLLHFDFAKPRVLQVDSSGFALSGILSQKDLDGKLRPVAYYSKKLSPAEQRWQVHDQELGAIVACFLEWRSWLANTNVPVMVLSDHANLRYFMNSQSLTPRQARWAAMLSMYNFEILHTPGKLNPADPASRRPDFDDRKSHSEKVVLLGHRVLDISRVEVLFPTSVSSVTFDTSFAAADPFIVHCLKELYIYDDSLLHKTSALFSFTGDLWWYRDRLYVPPAFRQFLLGHFHGNLLCGHWGILKTLDLISRTFSWPGLREDVSAFVARCVRCQQIKVDHRAPQGELIPLPIPDRPWSTIGVDFIVKLPVSGGFDSIMVVVDHYSKSAHFIPAKESWTAQILAEQFLSSVFKLHGLPDKIVSDRGATFVSKFWTALLRQLRIQPAPSTAFHPATDGQVERVNAILEDYLRHFVSLDQADWSSLLPCAEFSYNNSPSSSTSLSPFFSIHGFHPRFNSLTTPSPVPAADDWLLALQHTQSALRSALTLAKESQAKFYNRGRRAADTYAPGALVWLSRRHLRTSRPCTKLDVRRIGPLTVDRMVGRNAVKLLLPASLSRLHPVFNLSLVSPYLAPVAAPGPHDAAIPVSLAVDLQTPISSILGFRSLRQNSFEYLVRDSNTSTLNDAWVPLQDLPFTIRPFLRRFHLMFPSFGPCPC